MHPVELSNSQHWLIQSYDAVDYNDYGFLTVKTLKSSDKMLSEIKKIASRANQIIILHTSEQLTGNLLEKLIKEEFEEAEKVNVMQMILPKMNKSSLVSYVDKKNQKKEIR